MKYKNWLIIGGILILIVVAFGLRYYRYAEVPVVGDSLDEYSFSWVGLSLIRAGYPVGGLGVGGYTNQIYRYLNPDHVFQTQVYNNPIEINYPWFDHPPMMGVVTGTWGYMRGARVFEDLPLRIIRQPMIILGTLSSLLVLLLGWRLYGFGSGMFAGILYATSPLIVTASRMVQAENGYIPLFLLAILLVVQFQERLIHRYLFWAVILAGVAIGFKFSAVSILISILLLVPKNYWLKIFLWYLPWPVLILCYGLGYDAKTWWNVLRANGSREYAIGPNALFELITKPRITHLRTFSDGSAIASWLGFFSLLGIRTHRVLVTVVLSILAVYLLFGNFPHGWYALPFWPFLFVGLGYVFYRSIRLGETLLLPIVLVLLQLGVFVSRAMTENQFMQISPKWKLVLPAILLGVVVSQYVVRNKKINRGLGLLIFGFSILINLAFVSMLSISFWYKIS